MHSKITHPLLIAGTVLAAAAGSVRADAVASAGPDRAATAEPERIDGQTVPPPCRQYLTRQEPRLHNALEPLLADHARDVPASAPANRRATSPPFRCLGARNITSVLT